MTRTNRADRWTSATVFAIAVCMLALAGCSSGPAPGADDAGTVELAERWSAGARSGADSSISADLELGENLLDDRVARSRLRERAISLLSEFAFSEVPLLRANAIEALHPTPARVGELASAGLADPSPAVRSVAAMTIGQVRLRDRAIGARPLLADTDERVRLSAIMALASNGFAVDRSPLAAALEGGSPSAASHAVFILGELGDPSAIAMLRDRLTRPLPGDRGAQRKFLLQAAEAMVKLGDTRALSTIRAALYPAQVEDFEFAVLAAQMIGELGDADSAPQLIRCVEFVTPDSPQGNSPRPDWYRTDPSAQTFVYPPELRLAASAALAKLGLTDGVYVADQYRRQPEAPVRAQAAFTFGQMWPDDIERSRAGQRRASTRVALAALPVMLEDSSAFVRLHAAAATLELLTSLDG